MDDYQIGSMADFQVFLRETDRILCEISASMPGYAILDNIHRQLEAIVDWTSSGRKLARKQKDSINFGLITARELDDSSDQKIQDLANRLHALSGYFDRNF